MPYGVTNHSFHPRHIAFGENNATLPEEIVAFTPRDVKNPYLILVEDP